MRGLFAIMSLYIVFFCFSSCRQAAKIPPKPFSPSILREQVFHIDPSLDTTIITAHGAQVRIQAGAFAADGRVELTIREAFTTAEILAAGLTTESDGRPLRSGGMIYINAKAGGEMTTLVKPLDISIPYLDYDSAMKVFKGVETDSGTINWVEPDTLNRPLVSETTPKADSSFPGDSSAAISLSRLACPDDTIYVRPSQPQISQFAEVDNPLPDQPSSEMTNTFSGKKEVDNPEDRKVVFTDRPISGMYEFQIKTFGWYNIDAYMDGYNGTSVVKVWAQLQGKFDADINVYLFCPDKQLLSVSNGNDTKGYYFDKINGGVPLFTGDRAILFAFGNKGTQFVYGVSEFFISTEQVIHITIKEAAQQELLEALQNKNINGIDLGVEKMEMKIVPGNCNELNQPDTTKAQ